MYLDVLFLISSAQSVGFQMLRSGFAISVKTFEGEVTLTESVDPDDAKERATEVASSVYGVKQVNNLLKVQ